MIHLTLFEAEYYEKREGKSVQCLLCPRNCVIKLDSLGNCKARKNIDGTLYALGYNRFTSFHADPIEKKPIYHYKPGTRTMSFGTAGCNLHCAHCQNWGISQISAESSSLITITPQNAIDLTKKSNCETIAYTYNEPLINFEWIKETGQLSHSHGFGNILVSNGLINEKPLSELLTIIDAANIDIKAFTEKFYKDIATFPGLEQIKRNVITMYQAGIHIELTMLLIPTLNDNPDETRASVDWVLEDLNNKVPIHFSRFHPDFELRNIPATPVETILNARNIAEEAGLRYVYTGNLPYSEINTTICQNCEETLVERIYYNVKIKELGKDGRCRKCGEPSDIRV